MPSPIIQWFPGHMAKTRRMITENLKQIDLVVELLDARIPASSKNPEIDRLVGQKPVMTVLAKASLADAAANRQWLAYYQQLGKRAVAADFLNGFGVQEITSASRELLADKLERYGVKGMAGRTLKAMVVGIPNVGKSSFINRLSGGKKAKVENRPGVTLNKQWVTTSAGFDLLDMPGVLWPKFEDQMVGENLAMTGAIKEDILDLERVSAALCGRLRERYPTLMAERYRLGDMAQYNELRNDEILELIGKKRGYLLSGGEVDLERTSHMLLNEFQSAKIGRITLELPPVQ